MMLPQEPEERGAEGILKFPLPEQSHEFNLALNAVVLQSTLHEIDEKMRQHLKYGDLGGNGFNSTDAMAEWVRNEIADIWHIMEY